MSTYISIVILAIAILIPLGFKWQIKTKIILPGALAIGLITGFIINGIIGRFVNLNYLQSIIIAVFITFLLAGLAILFSFYRDPDRTPPNERGVVLSPADGKLIYIKKIEAGKVPYSQKKGEKFEISDLINSDIFRFGGYLIGISMNFLNVHVNRAPIKGRIMLVKHIKGRFFSLRKEEAILQNERVLMVIKNDEFQIGIVQIASRLVRRIVTYLKEGDIIEMGQKVGMIKFGSQVDVILPNLDGLQIQVKEGDELKAGVSVIAKYHCDKGDLKNAI